MRIAGIDIARGLAIYLMFQSHTVKGLLFFRDMPDLGVVPMHTITKFSSSLFILVFGVTLGVIFAPRTLDEERWPATRNHLWWRAAVVFFWYKVLTVVQTFQTRPRDVIVDMLLFKKFPDFVEILDFYSWVLLLVPLLLPLWRRLPVWVGPLFAAALAVGGQLLAARWDFFGLLPLKAILVEDQKLFSFGVLTRGPLAMLGLFLGDLLGRADAEDADARRLQVAGVCVLAGLALLGIFFALYSPELAKVLEDIARNRGKHPPQLFFMTFSVGGSLVLLGLCLLIGGRGPLLLKPLEILGRESLATFVWHIVAIFVGLRWLLDLKRMGAPKVTYGQALLWTGVVTATGIGVALANSARKRWQRERRQQREAEEALLYAGPAPVAHADLSALAAFPDTIPESVHEPAPAPPQRAVEQPRRHRSATGQGHRGRGGRRRPSDERTQHAEQPVRAAAGDHRAPRTQHAEQPVRAAAERRPAPARGRESEEDEAHEAIIKDLLD